MNYNRTQAMGEERQTDMVGKTVVQHSLKTKAQICHLSNTNTIKIRDEVIHMDSQLLFKRPGNCQNSRVFFNALYSLFVFFLNSTEVRTETLKYFVL